MENKQPTEAQIKEFWERCGLKRGKSGINTSYYTEPGDRYYTIPAWELDIDLNNLFKYAVPKLPANTFHINFVLVPAGYACDILTVDKTLGYGLDKDPALALFWAIWEVFHGE